MTITHTHTHTHTHTGIRMPPLLSPSSISHTLPIESVGPSDPPRLNGRSNAHSSAGVRSPTISVCVCTPSHVHCFYHWFHCPFSKWTWQKQPNQQAVNTAHTITEEERLKSHCFCYCCIIEAQNKDTEWKHTFTQCWWVFKGLLHSTKNLNEILT